MTRRAGLGRGLDALIPGDDRPAASGVLWISVEQIIPNPRQPRNYIDKEELNELAASIQEHGLIQPLVVTSDPEKPDQYILIAGERRWLAARLSGLELVPAILREASDQQRLQLALIENVQRANLNPLETAEAYRQLAEDFHLSHEEIAAQVFKSRSSVTNTLRLLKLPEGVRSALAEGKISEGHARALLALPTSQAQSAALQSVLKFDLNVRQTEELVKRLSGEKASPTIKASPNPEMAALEERLRGRLGTRVRLTHHRKGGTIVIHYYSDEELNALVEQLLGKE
jgi:ParB family transcriptional regulator, chromosome partitioning protein